MKISIKPLLIIVVPFVLSSCNKSNELSKNSANPITATVRPLSLSGRTLTQKQLEHAAAISNKYLQLYKAQLDTNNMDPRKIPAVVNYKGTGSKDTSELSRQKNFIRNSGFPVASDRPSMRNQNTPHFNSMTEFNQGKMSSSFESTHSQYENFVNSHVNHPYINVYKQNAGSLIIRKYLLDKPENNARLKFYFEELLSANSQDYPIIYLGLKQIRNGISKKELEGYKRMIHSNKEAEKTRYSYSMTSKALLDRSHASSGVISQAYLTQATLLEIPVARADFFIHKIDEIQ